VATPKKRSKHPKRTPDKPWIEIGERWCAMNECADFDGEDFKACMEACRKAWCEATPKEEEQASEKYPRR